MRTLSTLMVLTLLAVPLAGCASSRAVEDASPRRQPNVITAEEMATMPTGQNTYDAIRGLRGNWLQPRGVGSISRPNPRSGGTSAQLYSVIVYVEGSRMGGPEALRQVQASQVQEARFLNATEASSRLGTDHPGGAIMITLRR